MSLLKFTNFGGEVPRVSARALPPDTAQVNKNLLATSTEFRPMQGDRTIQGAPPGAATLYRLSRNSSGAYHSTDATGWITEMADKNYVKGPLVDDASERTYVTFNDGTARPRVIDATGQDRILGVPSPAAAPATTLRAKSQFTYSDAVAWRDAVLIPAVAEAVRASLVESRSVVGASAPAGMVAASTPTSQRGLDEPDYVLWTTNKASAKSTGVDDPLLGGVLIGGTALWLGIAASPLWGTIPGRASAAPATPSAFENRLRLIENPKSSAMGVAGSQVWDDARIATVAKDIAAKFDPATSSLSAKASALDAAVKDFKASIDLLIAEPTKPTPTAVKPTTPEWVTSVEGSGDNATTTTNRSQEWVAYDAALTTDRNALDAFLVERAGFISDQAGRVSAMVKNQETAKGLSNEVSALYADLKTNIDTFLRELFDSYGLVKTEANPLGIIAVDADRVVDSRFYITTLVTDWSEESAPSPVSTMLEADQNDTVRVAYPVELSNPSFVSLRHIQKWRIYRSNVGSSAAAFQFVAELLANEPYFDDAVKGAELGEVCPSITWLEPPYRLDDSVTTAPLPPKGVDPYLRGLTAMPNGILAGFIDNYVAFCDPFHMYAWPIEYQIPLEYPIVGLGAFGQTLFVGTKGSPYLISGSDSASMSAIKMDVGQACVSRSSIVTSQAGAIYASPDGICFCNGGGVEVVTLSLFSREDWQALNPSSVVGAFYEGVYYFSYTGNGGGTYALDMVAKKLVRFDVQPSAIYVDLLTNGMYYTDSGVLKRAFDTSRRVGHWKSGKLVRPKYAGYAWLQADFEGGTVTVNIYADGELRFSAQLASIAPVRVPSGRWLEYEIEVISTARVTKVLLASSTEELQGA